MKPSQKKGRRCDNEQELLKISELSGFKLLKFSSARSRRARRTERGTYSGKQKHDSYCTQYCVYLEESQVQTARTGLFNQPESSPCAREPYARAPPSNLPRTQSAFILHDCRQVAISLPALDECHDVELMEAWRIKRHPARLLKMLIPERGAQRRLRKRHRAACTLCVGLVESERDHEVEQLQELVRHPARDALRLSEQRVRDALGVVSKV